jgi:hypothetical protein
MKDMKNMGGDNGCCCPDGGESSDYPGNLRISLTDDQMEALGIAMPCVGETMNLTATVLVAECSDREYSACTVQITEMDLTKPKARSSMYPSMEQDGE